MATATKKRPRKGGTLAQPGAAPTLANRPPDAVRVSLPGQPKADVKDLGDGTYEVSYPGPQKMFWPEGSEPKPVVVAADGEKDAYNRAGGITGHDRPHDVED